MAGYIDIANPTRTQAILNQYGLRAKKKFGQNFLTDLNILHGIVDVAQVSEEDIVVEIGPGIGALTEQLAKRAKHVLAFEIDHQMVEVLADTLQPYDNVTVIEEDILKVDLPAVLQAQFGSVVPVKIVANLPYYITTPILMQLLRSGIAWQNIVVMMQKEVADRLSAPVGDKAYGSLTLAVQYYAQTQMALKVPAQSFNPAPNVESAVVKLTPLTESPKVVDEGALFDLIKVSFAHRRKSLWNNLQQRFGKDEVTRAWLTQSLEQAEIAPSIRAERLSLTDFIALSTALNTRR